MSWRRWTRLALGGMVLLAGLEAHAAGPRWVTGQPYFWWTAGTPIVWYTNTPKIYTDPGDLSVYVTHAQADAIVDAAANVWNVPISLIELKRGGTLDEDVNSANVYVASTGVVFPTDVQAANYAAKQIAVIYDRDGSVTDMLLGAGASVPAGCRQNGVTESVDSFDPSGKILHAVIVLNGRCTGPAPEAQLQMQYQLMRAFGRVLGLAWSQVNDNVFTGAPQPTYPQMMHWPVMHPIDVICATYTYQCMASPFTLRDDDLSNLALLYHTAPWVDPPPGKEATLARASLVQGTLTFPNGQGMQGINVVITRNEPFWAYADAYESTSGVTGYTYRRNNGNPVSGPVANTPMAGQGTTYGPQQGTFMIYRTPIDDGEDTQQLIVRTQPVNPLYTGQYAVGPYETGAVAPSGSNVSGILWYQRRGDWGNLSGPIADAATGCDSSGDGTESAPAAVDATGWWTGNLCSYGHASWLSVNVKANRSLTYEVTAKDESGGATTLKMLPVLGAWKAEDARGTLPTVAAVASAFNSAVTGMTRLSVQRGSGAASQALRLVLADQRGDGRPDYAYQGRVFYADRVTPANVPARGGTVTIQGMGFRPGNTVTVNGLSATVSSWTANSITAVVPSLHASTAVVADVTVRDLVTGATSTMTGALSYAAPQPWMGLTSAPSGTVFTNVTAGTMFGVRAVDSDGVTPVSGVAVTFSASAGTVRFGVCGAATCTVTTDAQGTASTTVTLLAAGSVTIVASSAMGSVSASFVAVDRVQTVTALTPALYVAEGATVSWPVMVQLGDNGAATSGLPVAWSAFAGMQFAPASSTADSAGVAQSVARVGPLHAGLSVTGSACAWTSVCAVVSATAVGSDAWVLQALGGAGQSVAAGTALSPVVLQVVDPQGHPVAGVPVEIHQTLEPWVQPCSGIGRCPIAPVWEAASQTVVTALDGTLTVAPLDRAGQAVVSRMVAVAGSNGFVSLSLVRQP